MGIEPGNTNNVALRKMPFSPVMVISDETEQYSGDWMQSENWIFGSFWNQHLGMHINFLKEDGECKEGSLG